MTVSRKNLNKLVSCFAIASTLAFGNFAARADHIDPVLSRLAAQEALENLAVGDRQSAILRALEGLPPNPTPAEIAVHPESWSALWRAVASKVVMLEGSSPVNAAINPDGTRMLIASAGTGELDASAGMPISLVDTASGQLVGTPIPASEADQLGFLRSDSDLTFSPDGRFAVASLLGRGVIAILDGTSGDRLHEIRVGNPYTIHLGFSNDSRFLATTDLVEIIAWDVESGAQIVRIALPAPSLTVQYFPVGWLPDNRILIQKVENFRVSDILAADANGISTFVSGVDLNGSTVLTYTGSDHTIVSGEDKTLVIGPGGVIRSQLPGAHWVPGYVRDGKALAFLRHGEEMSIASLAIDLWDLSGPRLEPLPSDYGRFNSFVFSPQGEIRGFASLYDSFGQPYAGADIPGGPDLYQVALRAIGRTSAPASGSMSAVADDTDVAILNSMEFARKAQAALQSGDRAGALIASLKGLPEEPQQADFDRFEAAHLMLFRATAARAFRVDTDKRVEFEVTTDGRRAVVRFLEAAVHLRTRAFLYDAGKGEQIAELMHPNMSTEGFAGDTTLPFLSPDGSLVALELFNGDRLAIFRTSDGAFQRDLMIPNPDLRGPDGTHLRSAGFSHDSSRVAIQNRDRLFLFDPSSGSLLETVQVPPLAQIVGWGRDGRLYFSHRDINSPMQVLVYQGGVFFSFVTLTRSSGAPDFGALILPSRQSSHILAFGDDSSFTVYDRTGKRSFDVGGGLQAYFIRNGEAVAVPDVAGDVGENLSIYNIDGTQLEVEFEDYVGMDSGLFNQHGQLMMFRSDESSSQWDGKGTPRGRALYEMIWNAIPGQLKSEISAERVTR